MIQLKTGRPSEGMSFNTVLGVLCCTRCPADKLGVDCAGCTAPDCPTVACTPPAENSNPSGASDGADGQGACIPRYSLSYTDLVGIHGQPGADVVESGFDAPDAVALLSSLFVHGVKSVTVARLP